MFRSVLAKLFFSNIRLLRAARAGVCTASWQRDHPQTAGSYLLSAHGNKPERAERYTSLKGKAESTVLAAISDPLGTGFLSHATAGLALRALARFIAKLIG